MPPSREILKTTRLSESSPLVNLDAFEAAFADWLALPSYLEIADTDHDPVPGDVGERYHTAIEAARDIIYRIPELTEPQKEEADRMFLNNVFLSSDGAEGRFVMFGYKPVSIVGRRYDQTHLDQKLGGISVRLLGPERIYCESAEFPDIGFTYGMFRSMQRGNRRSGYLYNRSAVARVARENEGILTKLGYDIARSPDHIVEDVFGSGTDPVAESILKGYPPLSAISFYLEYYPGDLAPKGGSWGVAASTITGVENAREQGFWRSLHILLTSYQLKLAQDLAAQEQSLELIGRRVNNLDYIYPTDRNASAQRAWVDSGIQGYLTKMRTALLGSKSKDKKFNFM